MVNPVNLAGLVARIVVASGRKQALPVLAPFLPKFRIVGVFAHHSIVAGAIAVAASKAPSRKNPTRELEREVPCDCPGH